MSIPQFEILGGSYPSESMAREAASLYRARGYRYDVIMAPDCLYHIVRIKE